jgi:hypothetical protein
VLRAHQYRLRSGFRNWLPEKAFSCPEYNTLLALPLAAPQTLFKPQGRVMARAILILALLVATTAAARDLMQMEPAAPVVVPGAPAPVEPKTPVADITPEATTTATPEATVAATTPQAATMAVTTPEATVPTPPEVMDPTSLDPSTSQGEFLHIKSHVTF